MSWAEAWYPVAGIGGVTYAAAGGALNLFRSGDTLHVPVYPLIAIRGQLTLTIPGLAPITRPADVSPARPFTAEIALSAAAALDDVALTLTDERGQTVLAWRGAVARR